MPCKVPNVAMAPPECAGNGNEGVMNKTFMTDLAARARRLRRLTLSRDKIGLHHFFDQTGKGVFGLPAQLLSRFGRIAYQQINFRRAQIAFVDLHVLFVVQPDFAKSSLTKFPDGVRLARRDDVVVRFVLQEH